ncbi:ATP-binding protein [Aidingimonas halophila]|uniref:histidine kinase n=1 Tax=Aidingimonas halophila TaxID=574349 RepID=A0A1H2QHC6_9GAMM|nr:ATP-binding protein [Aidingimonas halophila]GHC20837.1 two-component sensor histidine kinase [Aidingimonas halophila]SDW05849.1 two-component system, OmpR family, sensor histidine kinase QseC [Aidingimonas halophila]
MTSIRRYLSRSLALTFVIVTLTTVTAAYLITDHELEEMLDAELGLSGRIVSSLLKPGMTSDDLQRIAERLHQPDQPARFYRDGEEQAISRERARRYHPEERKLAIGIWEREGELRLIGGGWHDAAPPFPERQGYEWLEHEGHRWRVLSVFDDDSDYWLRIGVRKDFHQALVEQVTLNHLVPMVLLLPLLLWVMMRIIRRGLRPITTLSAQVEARHERDMSPIDTPVPQELSALRESVNGFIVRLGDALERERRFTADAAHELRTPLAALKIQLDNAMAGEHEALYKAYGGIERLQRVVEQLLILAQLDRQSEMTDTHVDLYALVMELAAELWPLAEVNDQTLQVSDAARLHVTGDATELGILIRNLLDNALRYTPEGGRVDVTLGSTDDRQWMTIRDTGPGVPEELLGVITDRFRRASDQRISGSGLGLAIVVELARRQRVYLTLTNRSQGGLEARLDWGDSGDQ